MAGLIYQLFTSSTLLTLGLFNLVSTIRNFLKSPQSYSAKPFHQFPFSSDLRLKHLPLYLLILCLFVAFLHQSFIPADPDPLQPFTALQSAAVLLLFFVLAVVFLLSEFTSLFPLSSDLFFAFASAVFFLHYSAFSGSASDLLAKCESLSARISSLASLMCLILAYQSKAFIAEVGLGAALCLQGLWQLQTGLSLYVEAFIPEGCHRMLDVKGGVEGFTKCEVDESKLRAVAILDLLFVVHAMVVVFIVMLTYALVAKIVGMRRLGNYEPLPNNGADSNLIQMKALSGTQA